MESLGEKNCQSEICDISKHNDKPNDTASDRESSVESFYTNKSEISNTADSDLIDVDDIELSDEESWLYKSPKKVLSSDKRLSTQKWLHKSAENMDDVGLNITKDALVSKLKQLKLHEKASYQEVSAKPTTTSVVELPSTEPSKVNGDGEKTEPKQSSVKGKENEVLDVKDVHKIAQLQEESLRQSTSRFLSQGEKNNGKHIVLENTNICKPASVEALNICNGRNDIDLYTLAPMQGLKKQNHFGSASLLNKQDTHRSSLPNINPGYYSLRLNKSKRPDPRIACPLPMYPTHLKSSNGAVNNTPPYESHRKPTPHIESRTLPSSYRVNGRSSSASRRESSSSFLPSSRNSPTSHYPRRESAPTNPPKYSSPMASPTLHQRGNLPLHSPSRNPPRSPVSAEYHRSTSHSPSRRLPLTTMHNRSPKHGNSPASPRNEDVQAFKLASKIPSPGLRSGIPVPSAYMARVNSDDESWSNDCF